MSFLRIANFHEKWCAIFFGGLFEFIYWRGISCGVYVRAMVSRDMLILASSGGRKGNHLALMIRVMSVQIGMAIPLPIPLPEKKFQMPDLETLPPTVVAEAEPLATFTLSCCEAKAELFWKHLILEVSKLWSWSFSLSFWLYNNEDWREEVVTHSAFLQFKILNLSASLELPLWREANPNAAKA